jgi:regulation of enolase protein 1 (concanavalin A-like superfamily)
MNLAGIDAFLFRVASNAGGGTIDVRVDDPEGPLIGSAAVEPTGGWQTWTTVTAELDEVPLDGSSVYFVIRRPDGSSSTSFLMNVNWLQFVGAGVTDNTPPVLTASADPLSGPAPLKVDFTASATDPDGDDPISFEWSFGDGASTDTADATHTYVDPGKYTAEVTATDARGAATSTSFEINVEGSPGVCLPVRSDDFSGDELDRNRWSTVIRENQDLRIEDDHLVIPVTNTDIYGTNNTNTPNIVLQPLPDGPFTATAKLTLEARRAYQQAGLVIYGDDDNYAKMVFQGRNTNQADANARIFQFIREENGAPNEVAASNTASLGAAYPDTVWVRFTSDGSNLRAAYSADGETFTDMPQTKSLAGIEDPHIGLIALSGTTQSPLLDAKFDSFEITPDESAGEDVDPNDEFDGNRLDECRWNAIVRPNPSAYRVADGHLQIETSDGDIWEGSNTDPENFILQDAPDGDWTIETKVDGSALNEQYQQGGLMAYVDDGNYVKFDYVVDNAPGQAVSRRIELRSEIGDVVQEPQPGSTSLSQGIWYLRLTKEGDTYRGSYSADGEDWTELAQAVTNGPVSSGDTKVGVFALGGPQQETKTVRFDYFRIEQETETPSLDVSVVAGTRCVVGKAMVTVQVTNNDTVPVSVRAKSAYGSKSFASVEPGRNAFHAFTTREVSIPAGSVEVEVSAVVDGDEVKVTVDADYDATSCG